MSMDWIAEYREPQKIPLPYDIVRAFLPLSYHENQALYFIMGGFEPYPRENEPPSEHGRYYGAPTLKEMLGEA